MTEIYSFTVLDAESLKSRCWQSHTPSEASGGGILFSLLVSGDCWQFLPFLGLSIHHSNLGLRLHHGLRLFVFVSKFPFSYKDTNHIGFRVHPNLVWPHLILTTSAKTLFPNGVPFTGSGWMWIWEGHYSTLSSSQSRKNSHGESLATERWVRSPGQQTKQWLSAGTAALGMKRGTSTGRV